MDQNFLKYETVRKPEGSDIVQKEGSAPRPAPSGSPHKHGCLDTLALATKAASTLLL